jgi:alkanesulfonate monooxygenase SsuD/methylene tetrahydromethanopterin reductase-like flavin-dependent oxidoreductase (luciferase family)
MRAFLDAGRVDLEGRFFAYRGVFSAARPVGPRVPLLVGAMGGPLTFRLAGELADGVYAACSFSPDALRYIVENVRQGAERASRDWRSLELCASLTSAISEDGESARIAARTKAAFYLPSMPRPLIERHGVSFTEVEPINQAFARGDVATALALTPPELADRFCIAGTPEEVAARVREDVLPSGIEHVVLALTDRSLPHDWAGIDLPDLPDLADQIRLIGQRVLPAL